MRRDILGIIFAITALIYCLTQCHDHVANYHRGCHARYERERKSNCVSER
jgi:hypothetical protein